MQPHLKLHDGTQFPAFGLGTWKSKPNEVYKAVRVALEAGYLHLDCAAIYQNEDEVGKAIADAIKAGDTSREKIWVTSKLWNDSHEAQHVEGALQKTLSDLGLEYLDLYLIHWPVAFKHGVTFPRSREEFLTLEEAPLEKTWEAMAELKAKGLTRQIGVSNMGPKRIDLLSGVGETPAVNQVESHPYLPQTELLTYCQSKGIQLTAYSPLGSPDRQTRKSDEPSLLEHPTIKEIAEKHGVGTGDVLIAWALGRGTSVIPKSVTDSRIRSNLKATELKLDADDMGSISNFGKSYRYIDGTFFAGPNSPYTADGIWA